MVVSQIDLGIALFISICAIMGTIIPKEGGVLFITLAAFGFFYGGFMLIGSAYNLSQTIIYGAVGICCLVTLIVAITHVKTICADDPECIPETKKPATVVK